MSISLNKHREADEQAMDAEPKEQGLEKFQDSDDDDPQDPAYIPETTLNRKRKRMESVAHASLTDNNDVKKLRRTTSDLGKEFGCSEDGCRKRFKTVSEALPRPVCKLSLTDPRPAETRFDGTSSDGSSKFASVHLPPRWL